MAVERLRAPPVEEDLSKAARLPRWTRQELLVLIQGKRVAEGRAVRRGGGGQGQGQSQVEPKWSSVSSYCKRHGVNRGPVQCRKRWSNLAGDFKKIKEWESQIKEESESFWVMRNDLRRERKLPGFFDREVYDILDAPGDASLLLSLAPLSLSLSHTTSTSKELVFDSGRPDDDALFSDDAMPSPTPHKPPTPISATQYERPEVPPPPPPPAADKETSPDPEGRKRKRPDPDEISLQKQLIEAMERNGRLLSSQLEIQNTNSHLDREQRKDHANSLFALLNKLADAMVRIADKL